MPRAIIGHVMAMVRPRRPLSEAHMVREAAAQLTKCESARAKASHIAKRVAAEVIAYADADPFDQKLAVVQATFEPSPIAVLAACPTIDTIALVYVRRAARFEARGCRQLSEAEWAAETRAIGKEVECVLTRRYRNFF